MGVKINRKHSKMSSKMETFIIDAIIVAKVKHSGGNLSKMAESITDKLDDRFGGDWHALVKKSGCKTGYNVKPRSGTFIHVTHDGHVFTVFKTKIQDRK